MRNDWKDAGPILAGVAMALLLVLAAATTDCRGPDVTPGNSRNAAEGSDGSVCALTPRPAARR